MCVEIQMYKIYLAVFPPHPYSLLSFGPGMFSVGLRNNWLAQV